MEGLGFRGTGYRVGLGFWVWVQGFQFRIWLTVRGLQGLGFGFGGGVEFGIALEIQGGSGSFGSGGQSFTKIETDMHSKQTETHNKTCRNSGSGCFGGFEIRFR